jgi:hypothetical protein
LSNNQTKGVEQICKTFFLNHTTHCNQELGASKRGPASLFKPAARACRPRPVITHVQFVMTPGRQNRLQVFQTLLRAYRYEPRAGDLQFDGTALNKDIPCVGGDAQLPSRGYG